MKEIYNRPEVARAADWNLFLDDSEESSMANRCNGCYIAPLNLAKWLRMVKPSRADEPGRTTQHGHWRCAATYEYIYEHKQGEMTGARLEKWGAGEDGEGRALILRANRTKTEYEILFMRKRTGREEHVLTLLKSAKLLSEAEDNDEDSLKEAIDKLNQRHEAKLTTHVQARWIRAATKEQTKAVCKYTP